MFVGQHKSRAPVRCSTYVGFGVKLKTLDQAGKVSQGQTLQLITNKSFITFGPDRKIFVRIFVSVNALILSLVQSLCYKTFYTCNEYHGVVSQCVCYFHPSLILRARLEASGLYYKHMTIVNDDSRVINKLEASLTDDTRVIIYDCHLFIVHATALRTTPH